MNSSKRNRLDFEQDEQQQLHNQYNANKIINFNGINNLNNLNNINNINNINNLNIYNNENDINKLFYKVWHNQYIRKIIFYHLKLFNLNFSTRIFFGLLNNENENQQPQQQKEYYYNDENDENDENDGDELNSYISDSDYFSPIDYIQLFNQHPYKSYLKSIKICIGNNDVFQIKQFLKELPPNIDTLELIDDYKGVINEPLEPGFIPSTLTSLIFSCSYSLPIKVNVIPSTLKELVLPFDFNHSLLCESGDGEKVSIFPKKGLVSLEFGTLFNQPILPGVLPETLESLFFGEQFNQILPENSINLPSIIHQGCRGKYSQKVYPGVYSPNLRTFFFNGSYRAIIPNGVLPESLTKISVFDEETTDFSGKIEGGLNFKNLKIVRLYGEQNSQIINHQVNDENKLFLKRIQENKRNFKFPDTIEELSIGYLFHLPLPKYLKRLYLGSFELPNHNFFTIDSGIEENKIINQNKIIVKGMLPETLESLYLNKDFILKDIDCLPSGLKKIQIGCFNYLSFLPKSIEYIKFDNVFNHQFKSQDKEIFKRLVNLRMVQFGSGYSQSLPTNLFAENGKLISLKFGDYYSHEFKDQVLPPSLKSLKVGYGFRACHFNRSVFPPSLELFDSTIINDIQLPKSINYLIIRDSDESLLVDRFLSIKGIEQIFIENTINGILNNFELFNKIIYNYLNDINNQYIFIKDIFALKKIFKKINNTKFK